MPRVLVVTSMFLPYLAADMHRARLLAAELPAQGWKVELLVPGDAFQRAEHHEPDAGLLAVDVPVHRAEPELAWLFGLLNSRSLAPRAYRPLRRLGDALLSTRRFDLVYFSCSQPALFHLGVGWKRRHGVPFVLDLHDPWYSEQLPEARHLARWRRALSNRLARSMERATLREACALISVSPGYLDQLNARYRGLAWPALQPGRQAVIPFSGSDKDYAAARSMHPSGGRPETDGRRTIVYTGAGGVIMEDSFRVLCDLLRAARAREPALVSGVRILLFGTEPMAAANTPALTRVATQAGLADLVFEYPSRVSYLEALRHVVQADGLLVLGIDSAAYSPSKLFLYGATDKPLLACMREGSVVDGYFGQTPELGHLVHAGGAPDPGAGLPAVLNFLREVRAGRRAERGAVRDRWLAPEMARLHAEFFARCLGAPGGDGAPRTP